MLNIVDIILVVFILIFLRHAWNIGFWIAAFDFLSFFATLLVAFRLYPYVSDAIYQYTSTIRSVANALSFLVVAFAVEIIFSGITVYVVSKIPRRFKYSPYSKFFALLPGFGQALIFASFFLTLIFTFPTAPKIKIIIDESRIGSYLVRNTSVLEGALSEIFGDIARDSLTTLVVNPKSEESVPIDVETLELVVDITTEKEMQKKINEERQKSGVQSLIWSEELAVVARIHARDMWERKYFGHYSPDGSDVGDRLDENGVGYLLAGENLALAPTLDIAHTGLMNSPGHRENILEEDFNQVGIGVIDNGYYGKMFVQVFSN